MGKPFPRDHALHNGYRSGRQASNRQAANQLQKELKQLTLTLPEQPKASFSDLLKVVHGNAAMAREIQRADVLAEMDREALAEAHEVWPLIPGDIVRFTAAALHSMYKVSDWGMCLAPDRHFTISPCACDLCDLGNHVAVDGGRHIATSKLEPVSRAPMGPVRLEDEVRFLESVGMHVDESGRWLVKPL